MSRDHILAVGTLVLLVGCGGAVTLQESTDVDRANKADAKGETPEPATETAGESLDSGPEASPEAASPDIAPMADASASRDLPAQIPFPHDGRNRAIALAVGRTHTCVLLDDHRVKCWGDNGSGQLGLGDMRTRGNDRADMGDALPTVDLGTGRTAVALTAGRYATCAILDDGMLKCWGLPWLVHSPSPLIGDEPGEMGDNLAPIDLGPGRTAKLVAIGHESACALASDETLSCSGINEQPVIVPLAKDRRVKKLAGARLVFGLFDNGSVLGDLGGSTPPGILVENAKRIAGSRSSRCALLESGALNCWGELKYTPTGVAGLAALAITEYGETCGLYPEGVVRCWGAFRSPPWQDEAAEFDQGGVPVRLGQPAVDIGAGIGHACALLVDGSVKCWALTTLTVPAALGGNADLGDAGETWLPVDLGTRPLP